MTRFEHSFNVTMYIKDIGTRAARIEIMVLDAFGLRMNSSQRLCSNSWGLVLKKVGTPLQPAKMQPGPKKVCKIRVDGFMP